MKRIFPLLFLATLLVNCTADAQKIHVECTTDAEASEAYFVDSDAPDTPLATVKVTNGKCSADIPSKDGQLLLVATNSRYQQLFFNDGDKVSVDVVKDKIEGTGLNEKWGAFLAKAESLKGNSKALGELLKTTCKENADNKLSVAAIMMFGGDVDFSVLNEVLPDDAPYASHPIMAQIIQYKNSMSQRMPGSALKDIAIPDANGKMHKLSEYVGKGKVVLVDFWASWCGPCCKEMPNVVAAYDKYKSKGFEVVGVSLDQKKDAWLAAVKRLGMTWPQLSDLKGWKCEAAKLYGVDAIPSNILFDKDGNVIATDLTGAALQNKLKEIFGNN